MAAILVASAAAVCDAQETEAAVQKKAKIGRKEEAQIIVPAKTGVQKLARVMTIVALVSFTMYFFAKTGMPPFDDSEHTLFFVAAGFLSLIFAVFAVFQI